MEFSPENNPPERNDTAGALDSDSPQQPQSISQRQPPKRKKTYSDPECEALARAWINTSENPSIGADQKRLMFWEKISTAFNELVQALPGQERSQNSLQIKWGDINRDCTKFNGHFAKCKSLTKSGDGGEPEWIEKAKELFLKEMNYDFSYMSSWNILKYSPKWGALAQPMTSSGSKEKKESLPRHERPIGTKRISKMQKKRK